jgi:NTP pyrophosphatase (non-canonical NTP hydrolase)
MMNNPFDEDRSIPFDPFDEVDDEDYNDAFDNYQDQCAGQFAFYPGMLVYPAMGLAGEAGEVLEKVKKLIRDDEMPISEHFDSGEINAEKRMEIARECGDVLFYLAMVADDIDYKLSEIAHMNIEKLADRKERGQLRGSGDNR